MSIVLVFLYLVSVLVSLIVNKLHFKSKYYFFQSIKYPLLSSYYLIYYDKKMKYYRRIVKAIHPNTHIYSIESLNSIEFLFSKNNLDEEDKQWIEIAKLSRVSLKQLHTIVLNIEIKHSSLQSKKKRNKDLNVILSSLGV